MSIGRSAIAIYGAQVYSALVSVILLPLYLRYLGPEGYGLVGLFVVVQAWFTALDLGVPAIVTREVARWRGGAGGMITVAALLRTCEIAFLGIGALGVGIVILAAQSMAQHWLTVHTLNSTTVHASLILMVLACSLRWVSGLYRSVLVGLEQQGWLSALAALLATARFVLVLPLIALASNPVFAFFSFQVVVSIVELVVLAARSYRGLHLSLRARSPRFDWKALSALSGLGKQMALATLLWLAATQTDKVLLSRLLSLAEFGYFSVAVAAAGIVTMLAAPGGQLLMPHLSRLEAAHDEAGLRRAYGAGTQAVSALVLSVAGVLAACSQSIVWVWTGDAALATKIGPVLGAYAMGNAFLAIVALPYYLQFARGDLRLHNIGTGLLAALLVPTVVVLANRRGAVGAGEAWLGATFLYLILWTPLVHTRHLPQQAWRWLLGDVGRVALPILFTSAMVAASNPFWPSNRTSQWACLMLTAVLVGIVAIASAPVLRTNARVLLARLTAPRGL